MIRRAWTCLGLMSETVGAGRVVGLLVLQFVVAVLEGAGLVLLVPVIGALGGGNRFEVPGLEVDLSLAEAFSAVIVVVLLRSLLTWRAAVLGVEIRLATIDRIRLGLIDDLYGADWRFVAAQRRSHVVESLTTNVERAQSAVAMVLRLFVGTFILIATAGVALLLAPAIGALALAAVLVVMALAARSTRGATRLGVVMSQRMADFGAALTDSLASARVMRAHGAEQAWSALVGEEAARVRDVRRRFVARSTMVTSTLSAVAVLAVLGLILIGREVGLSLAELATLIVVSTRLLTSAQGLLTAGQQFANDVPALERLAEFHTEIRRHPEVRSGTQATGTRETGTGAAHPGSPLLELAGVGVRYADGESAALADVDLVVPHRGLVAVVGPSGAGKSTLLDVVLGLLPVQEGEIRVDGEPLTDLVGWRARIGYVPQQTVLVPGTVWTNLTWSLQPGRQLTEEAAWEALRAARLAEVVAGLPDGLRAPLSELAQLSGGEQQRLSIARALVRDPELLVLDEATSALDQQTEAALLAALLDGSRAVLMVTHRALPEEIGGEVLRLENGRRL